MHPAKAPVIEMGGKEKLGLDGQRSVCLSVWLAGWVGLVLFRPVLERPTTGPVEKTGCWLRRCCFFFFFFFLETSTASTKALRPERAVVRRDSLPLPRSGARGASVTTRRRDVRARSWRRRRRRSDSERARPGTRSSFCQERGGSALSG